MKIIILVFSAALHLLLLLHVPGYRAPARVESTGHSIAFVGGLPDMLPSPYAERAERPVRPYSHYHSPEDETVIIEPEAFSYDVEPYVPPPVIDFGEAAEAVIHPDIPGEINMLDDSLSRYELQPVPFEESILP